MEDLEFKLIRKALVNSEQLSLAKQDAARNEKSVWVSLVKLGYLSEEDIAIFFAQESGINYVRISDYEINHEVLRLLDEEFCRMHLVMPLFKVKETLFVACSNPLDASLIDNLAKLVAGPVEFLIAPASSIIKALDLYRGVPDRHFDLVNFMFQQNPLQGLTLWRESERLDLSVAVNLQVIDQSVMLHYAGPIEGFSKNISSNGTALGLQLFLFVPKGVKVSLEFKPHENLSADGEVIKAEGEVVYCRMEKGQHYFLGIKFTKIEDGMRQQLFKLAGHA